MKKLMLNEKIRLQNSVCNWIDGDVISTALNHFGQRLQKDQKVLGNPSITVCIYIFRFTSNRAMIHIQLPHFQLTEVGWLMSIMTSYWYNLLACIFYCSDSQMSQSNQPRHFFWITCRNPNCRSKNFKSKHAYDVHRNHPANAGTLCADNGMMFPRYVEFPANVATARLYDGGCIAIHVSFHFYDAEVCIILQKIT